MGDPAVPRTVISAMDRQTFLTRSETFGFDTDQPWALPALRLLFAVPRAYLPLVEAWERRHPGTRRALDRLVKSGFVAYQGPVIVNTRTGQPAVAPTRAVARYRVTNRGRQLAQAATEDLRVLEEAFPRTAGRNSMGVLALLCAFDLDDARGKNGISLTHAAQIAATDGTPALPTSNVKWWVRRFLADGYLRELDFKLPDTREVIPAHWRITRALCRQLSDALSAFSDEADALKVEFRLGRSRFLGDADPARVGVSGATDYDHDIECQRILAAMLTSDRAAADGIFTVEPRITLPLDRSTFPYGIVEPSTGAADTLFYQPDAEIRERAENGAMVRSVVEYERFQSRRDAWSHIERFLGYLANRTLPFEQAVLRFVVDSTPRERTYVELIEAFADYALDHPERLPGNRVTLAVSSTPRVLAAADPLDPRAWFRVPLPEGAGADTVRRPALHPSDDSPYDQYFARA